MPALDFKTVILYNMRRIRPETLEAIRSAKDGDMVGVDQSEIDQFLPLVVHAPALAEAMSPPKPPVRAPAGSNAS